MRVGFLFNLGSCELAAVQCSSQLLQRVLLILTISVHLVLNYPKLIIVSSDVNFGQVSMFLASEVKSLNVAEKMIASLL